MARPLLPEELWKRVEPLLPPPNPPRFLLPGRKPIDDRKALTGILFVLKTGLPWEDLPQEMGCGSGMTLLATAARLAGRRGLGGAPRSPPRRVERHRQDRLVACRDRLLVRAGPGRRGEDRPQPGGPPEEGEQ